MDARGRRGWASATTGGCRGRVCATIVRELVRERRIDGRSEKGEVGERGDPRAIDELRRYVCRVLGVDPKVEGESVCSTASDRPPRAWTGARRRYLSLLETAKRARTTATA